MDNLLKNRTKISTPASHEIKFWDIYEANNKSGKSDILINGIHLRTQEGYKTTKFKDQTFLTQISLDCIVVITDQTDFDPKIPFKILNNILGDVVIFSIASSGEITVDFSNMRRTGTLELQTDNNYLTANPGRKDFLSIRNENDLLN